MNPTTRAVGLRRRRLLFLLLPPVLLAALLAVLELIGWLLLPAPPGLDTQEGRTAHFNATFYQPDPELVVRLRPNLRADFDALRPERHVEVQTNREGFRGADWEPPDPEALRVLVLGDSVTFGLNLAWADTWPQVMAERLRAGGRRVQVRNLAVPGYSSMQGLTLFRRHALEQRSFAPQVVVFAFGFNDGFLRPQSDAETRETYRFLYGSALGAVARLARGSRFLRLVLGDSPAVGTAVRVPPADLRAHLGAVAEGCRRIGARVLLADSCLPHGYAYGAMREVAERHGAQWISFRDVLAAAAGVERPAPWPQGGRVRIEVPTHGIEVPPSPDDRPPMYALVLRDPGQRARRQRLAMNDDGRDGDRVRGDGTWSCLTPVWEAGARPQVAFGIPGLADRIPDLASDALMLNGLHWIDLAWAPPGADGDVGTVVVAAPNVIPWPDLVLVPDPIHPSEQGARAIGEAMAAVVGG